MIRFQLHRIHFLLILCQRGATVRGFHKDRGFITGLSDWNV